ncbi:ABC transporter permease [Alkaliphilus peptidifermentans]|uniref:ABC-2 type transport system permease protein n=1 Tax=Alkaliphilus peptidifermentans DSM 18978 TaxID=1120976 RepID=A0A1G5L973_9FIRM|nr:ABC-2 family transporter protein [Alkaliphilus peptidifermentans]SCZ09503.1 ABC-2 type transport system permease protein [Alkaliphilus peptidifermentans DSM 18978]
MKDLLLYKEFIKIYLKSKLEYRFSFFMDLFIQIFTYTINYISIWIILSRFNNIFGWTFYEIMLLYNLNLFTYGISGLFIWGPMRQLEEMVVTGSFDSILSKPMNPFVHIIFRQFQHAFIGHVILGIIIFIISFNKLNIEFSILSMILFTTVIIGGVLIHSSIMIFTGSICFWVGKSNSLVDTTVYGLRFFLDYPISIYHRWVQIFLTFIVPYGFVNYYPAHVFLNKGDVVFNEYLKYGTPIVGVIVFAFSYLIWNVGINKYSSAGS